MLCCSLPLGARATALPLIIGLYPNLSSQRLFRLYQPLGNYLQQQLARPVQIYTAKNPRAFVDATRHGDFDIVLTPPHMAWLAELEANYRPLATYAATIQGVLIVAASSGLSSPAELRNTDIAIPDPLAFTTILGTVYLQQAGLRRGADYHFLNRGTHNNAALAVINGEVSAAIVNILFFNQLPEKMRGKLRIIGATPAVKSFFFMANPRLQAATIQAAQDALLGFGSAPHGRLFLDHSHFGRILPADDHSLAEMAHYGAEAQRLLKEPRP
ncbi:MAG: phosphate/phosphite/phosphonate ABC transporter substrate-binding protein [Sulfuriferula sp.]